MLDCASVESPCFTLYGNVAVGGGNKLRTGGAPCWSESLDTQDGPGLVSLSQGMVSSMCYLQWCLMGLYLCLPPAHAASVRQKWPRKL